MLTRGPKFRWLSKRCCINCDNPYAHCTSADKRKAVDTEGDAVLGIEKRCIINGMNPCANCSGVGPGGSTCQSKKRDEAFSQWPAKKCCTECDSPYARCSANDTREAVKSLDDALRA